MSQRTLFHLGSIDTADTDLVPWCALKKILSEKSHQDKLDWLMERNINHHFEWAMKRSSLIGAKHEYWLYLARLAISDPTDIVHFRLTFPEMKVVTQESAF